MTCRRLEREGGRGKRGGKEGLGETYTEKHVKEGKVLLSTATATTMVVAEGIKIAS